jgi:hypothetical protein
MSEENNNHEIDPVADEEVRNAEEGNGESRPQLTPQKSSFLPRTGTGLLEAAKSVAKNVTKSNTANINRVKTGIGNLRASRFSVSPIICNFSD